MKEMETRLRIGIPKGSLQETTQKLFNLAGYRLRISDRSYYPDIDDPEMYCILIRPQEMARYVEQGVLDCAITGLDWILETGADVEQLADLKAPWPNYGTVRWVLAAKEGSEFNDVKSLEGRHIATEAIGITKRFLAEHGVTCSLEFSWGATEVKPPILADAIVDVTETGSSLRANNLKVLQTVLESTPRFIANRNSLKDDWKRNKIDRLLMMINGAIAAATRVSLSMNVPSDRVDRILEILPALGTPTVSTLADHDWFEITTVVDELQVRDLIPKLYEAGARGIIELPINKLIG